MYTNYNKKDGHTIKIGHTSPYFLTFLLYKEKQSKFTIWEILLENLILLARQ